MPSEEQTESVLAEIERLQADRINDKPWTELPYSDRYVALKEIEWAGFSDRQEATVITRVMIGEPPELWMEGMDPPEPEGERLPSPEEEKSLFEEIRHDEHAARVRDAYGEVDMATYERQIREGAAMLEAEAGRDSHAANAGLARGPYSEYEYAAHEQTKGNDMEDQKETPLARVERQVEEVKKATVNCSRQVVGPWSEMDDHDRLRELELDVEWPLVSDKQKEALLAREVDFSKISRDQLNTTFEDLGTYDIEVDERPARRLFDKANYARAVAEADKTPFAEQMEHVRPVTRNLIEAVSVDAWPRNAAVVDFGIDSQQHYEALYYPIRGGEIAPVVLDAAMGHGAKLTEVTRNAPSNPHKDVQFHTSWDEMLGREHPEEKKPDTPAYSPQIRSYTPDDDRGMSR